MLEQYTCTRCFTHPADEKEIFNGCAICGNKMFKLEDSLERKIETVRIQLKDHTFDDVASIEVSESGVYHVNVDKLFKESKGPVLISDKEGVYHIKL